MAHSVLIFESDTTFAGELKGELARLGCTVEVTDDGSMGLERASALKPDLILLSVELPRMNGFSLCNKLKKDPVLKDIPLIIMSTDSTEDAFESHKKLRMRAEDYVHKPIAFADLLQHIKPFVPIGSAKKKTMFDLDDPLASEEVPVLDLGEAEGEEPTAISQAYTAPSAEVPKVAEPDELEAAFEHLKSPEAAPGNAKPLPPASAAPARRVQTAVPPFITPAGQAHGASPAEAGRADALEREKTQWLKEKADLQSSIAKEKENAARLEKATHGLESEVEELRAKLASVPSPTKAPPPIASSKEFLDLREALNKKDKEIVTVKEALGRKERELIEHEERALGHERRVAELDEKVLGLEDALEKLREEHATARTARDSFMSLGESAKQEALRLKSELEAAVLSAAEKEKAYAEEREKWKGTQESLLANLRKEHADAMDRLDESTRQTLEAAEQKHQQELALAEEKAKNAIREAANNASEGAERQTRELAAAHEAALAALRETLTLEFSARSEADRKALVDAEAKHANEIAEVREELGGAIAAAEARAASAESESKAAIEVAERTLAEKIESESARLRNEFAAKDAAFEKEKAELAAAHAAKAGELERVMAQEVASIERDRDDKLRKAESEKAEMERKLEEESARMKSQENERATLLSSLQEEIERGKSFESRIQTYEEKLRIAESAATSLGAELGVLRSALEKATAEIVVERRRAEKAAERTSADRHSLERAKDALAVALLQIEETENRAS